MLQVLIISLDCKIIERFRNIPLSDTINACKEWENTPPEQTVNPTNESTESESTESSSSEDSGEDGDFEEDDYDSEEDALTCLGLVGTFCCYRYFNPVPATMLQFSSICCYGCSLLVCRIITCHLCSLKFETWDIGKQTWVAGYCHSSLQLS